MNLSRAQFRSIIARLPSVQRAEVQAQWREAERTATPRRLEQSPVEQRFLDLWTFLEGPQLEREVRFAPPRKWRFDFSHRPSMTAIECEGGTYSRGRHVRPAGFEQDAEKYNAAGAAGWTVFRLTGGMVTRTHLLPIIERCKAAESSR